MSTSNEKFINGALHGCPHIVIEALEDGADVNYRDSSALVYAIRNHDLELVKFLFKMGSNIPDKAHEESRKDINIKLLLERLQKLSLVD